MQTGDKVTCVNTAVLAKSGYAPALELNKEYPVNETYTCKCNELHVDVGLVSKLDSVSCYKCGEVLPRGHLIHWANSIRFNKTPQQWWDAVKQSPERIVNWLKNQYHGEAKAAERIYDIILKHFSEGSTEWDLATRIAKDEEKHAVWIGQLLESRGITPQLLDKEERYWDAVLDDENVEGNGEYAAAIAAHAEEMRLARIKIIMDDEDAPGDIRATFIQIYHDEVFHAKAFKKISGDEYYNQTTENHARGLEALGLII